MQAGGPYLTRVMACIMDWIITVGHNERSECVWKRCVGRLREKHPTYTSVCSCES